MSFRASGMPRVMGCGAAGRFPPSRPETDGDEAREGTCAAWVGEMVINGDVATADEMVGDVHENGWVVDVDMARHIQWYVDTLLERDGHHQAEVRMDHPELPVGGTADHIGWNMDLTTLYIDDLKYGYGIVEPTTWQLVCYMWLCLTMVPVDRHPRLIQLSILQPRAMHRDGPYRKWVISIDEAYGLINQMHQRVVDIMNDPQFPATPGSHCKHCHAADRCVALQRSVYSMWDIVADRDILTPTPQQVSDELTMLSRMKDMFDARFAAIESEVEATLSTGGFIPGWHLEKKFGKSKFTCDDMTIFLTTGVDPAETKTCTPAELIRRGAKKDVVAKITTQPFIGSKLVRIDEDRIAKEFAKAKKG